jgi:alkanesulfonate monooxygenase SsuD/methylene tetrahydromethanopterin reductase-like flavin-dependent oxidoreductase (luciferase family)
MEIGVFHEFPRSSQADDARVFAQSFEQIEAAERWGLDAIWLSELHFSSDRSALSAPLTIASAIAARTSRMKIGTAVRVLPLCHPLRLAEEVATLDQISRGRLIFGVGRSSFPRTYEAHGQNYAESRERFAEILEIVKRAWAQPSFSYEGAYYRFNEVSVVPKPYQKPYPEIRVAATSPDSYSSIGRLGHPIFVASRTGSLSELSSMIRTYRETYRASGHPGHGEVYLRLPVYVAETYEQARDEPEESIMRLLRYVGDRLEDSATREGVRAIERRAERGQQLQTISYEEALQTKIVVGTPEMVADRLQELRAELGLDGIIAELNSGGLIPHERVMNALRLLCEQVMPRCK